MQDSLSELSEIRRLMSIGQLAGAERLCRQTLKLNPQLAEAWFLFAQVALAFNQRSEALHCVQQACRLEPHHQHYTILYAHVLYESGDAEAAHQLLKPVMTPEQPVSVQQLFGRASWRAGYYDDALRGFSASALAFPSLEEYVLPYCRALSLLGQRDLASKQINMLCINSGLGAESAALLAHIELDGCVSAELLQQCHKYCEMFPQHIRLRQLASLCQSWLYNHSPDFTHFKLAYQRDSVQFALNHRDQNTKLAGLPADVLLHAATLASQEGLWLEFGVYYGRSINILASHRHGVVHGFDSFQGLPEDWKLGEPKGSYSTDGRLPNVAANVRLHTGWFEHSLPTFLSQHSGPVSLVHIDCDLYSSTETVLAQLAGRLKRGSILIFDDFLGIEGFEQHEFRAFSEFITKYGFNFKLLSYAALGREIAFQLE